MQTAHAYTLSGTQDAPTLDTGRVSGRQDDHITISCRGGVWHARTAASCLLLPEKGDEVLFSPLPDGRAFVVAVLTRGRHEAVLDFPDGAALRSALPLRLNSAVSVEMAAPAASVDAAELKVHACEATAVLTRGSLMVHLLRTAGERLEQSFGRLLGRYGSSHRLVQEDDEVQARSVRVSAEGECLTQAGSVTHLARDLARIDAPQVHIS